ncbi:MAG TPA: dihydropteroate synthase [Pyrinomonadaceae bacterium]|nr:dihydropteroate synthase [Pyrinomonadaceae bacterium]
MRQRYILSLPRTQIGLGDRTVIMGILNVTPDSFSDGGQYFDREKAIARGKEIEQEGADIIDIGGESSRPGSDAVPEDEEFRRVLPIIEALAPALRIPISVDTYRASVAKCALQAGAQVVNDISAFRFDPAIASIVAKERAAAVLMHSRGSRDMLHKQSRMADPVGEVFESLARSVESARNAGIAADAIVIDPGIGFGKAAEESVEVLKTLSRFSKIGYPLLVGTSRKSFIRTMTSDTPEARNWGTAATIVAAIINGAHIVRVHDVRQARSLSDVTDRLAG